MLDLQFCSLKMSLNHVFPHQDKKIFLSIPCNNSILDRHLTCPEVATVLTIFSTVFIQVLLMNMPILIFILVGMFFIQGNIIIFLFRVLLRVRPLNLEIPEGIMIFRITFMTALSIK